MNTIMSKNNYKMKNKKKTIKKGIKTSKKLAKLSKRNIKKPIWKNDTNDIQNA